MKTCHIGPVLSLIVLFLTNCRTQKRLDYTFRSAEIAREGFVTCFDLSMADAKTWCEASAVLARDGRIFIANDKDILPPHSSVFYMNDISDLSDTTRKANYVDTDALRVGKKYEDFAQSPDGKWVFLTTAFDRVKDNAPDWDGYNTLLCWKSGQEANPMVVAPGSNGKSSVSYRKMFSQALNNLPYFKIEGLAATNTDLIWGIREEGQKFDSFSPKVKFLQTPYTVEKDHAGKEHIVLKEVCTVLRDFDLTSACDQYNLPKPLAVSSIEYDPARRSFWVLTSYEKGGDLCAYLWIISEKELRGKGDLTLIKTVTGEPLKFSHKAEDLTLLDRSTLLIIHDDDREKTRVGTLERKPNQAAYSIVKLHY